MGGLSLKVLNFNERPTIRLLCCYMQRKPVFFCFHDVWKVTFDSRILTVISFHGIYFEIPNFNLAFI